MTGKDALGSFLVAGASLPYCKGCGHAPVLRAVDQAVAKLGLAPSRVAVVTDIGCVGLADAVIDRPHTVHTTHGRSTAFATGIAVAHKALGTAPLATIVLVGDGGAMIGLNHLVYAALLNADVTVIVHNNFLFGMTGGQNSAFSPLGFVTATTKSGNTVPPLDLCRVLAASRAPFVARALATDRDLSEIVARAIASPGFAIVEVLELCTAHGTRRNVLTGSRMKELAEEAGYELGVLRDEPRPAAVTAAVIEPDADRGAPAAPRPAFSSALRARTGIVLAGTAGERVQTAATLLAEAAILSGLHATQKNDNPVTQGTGFSVSEVILSPEPIGFTGIERPDAVLVVSNDGRAELERAGVFARVDANTMVLADDEVALPPLACTPHRLPLRGAAGAKGAAAAAAAWWLRRTGALEPAAFEAALDRRLGLGAAETRASVERALTAAPPGER